MVIIPNRASVTTNYIYKARFLNNSYYKEKQFTKLNKDSKSTYLSPFFVLKNKKKFSYTKLI